MSVKQAQVCCSIQWIYSCSVYLYQCVMAVKQAGVSLALPGVKGLGGCLSSFRHISFFISLYKEQCIMKGKCKRASLGNCWPNQGCWESELLWVLVRTLLWEGFLWWRGQRSVEKASGEGIERKKTSTYELCMVAALWYLWWISAGVCYMFWNMWSLKQVIL